MNILTQLRNTFENRKVFITGHTGFKGSWLSLWLHSLGAEVTGFALPPEREQDLFALLNLHSVIRHTEGDIRDSESLRKAMDEARPEFVFHLAAQPLVRRAYRDPKTTFDSNIGGAVNLLEAVRSVPSVRILIYATSDRCYRSEERPHGYQEADPLGGDDPYSASTACAEMVFSSYQASYFEGKPAAASVRAGNMIGGGDWSEDRIVPDCIRALSTDRPIHVRNPNAVRPWQHVLEPLGGYLRLAAHLYSSQSAVYRGAWNFGPGQDSHHSVQELVDSVIGAWGRGKAIRRTPKRGLRETQMLYLNCDKADRLLNWRPTWDFYQSVERTVEWYKHALDGADAWNLTTWQLQAYCAILQARPVAETCAMEVPEVVAPAIGGPAA